MSRLAHLKIIVEGSPERLTATFQAAYWAVHNCKFGGGFELVTKGSDQFLVRKNKGGYSARWHSYARGGGL